MNEFEYNNQINIFKKAGYDLSNLPIDIDINEMRNIYVNINEPFYIERLRALEIYLPNISDENNRFYLFKKAFNEQFDDYKLKNIAVRAESGFNIEQIEPWFSPKRMDIYGMYKIHGYPTELVLNKNYSDDLLSEPIFKFYRTSKDPEEYIQPETPLQKACLLADALEEGYDLKEYIDFDCEQLTAIKNVLVAREDGFFIPDEIINKNFEFSKIMMLLYACEYNTDYTKLINLENYTTICDFEKFLHFGNGNEINYTSMVINSVNTEKIDELLYALMYTNFNCNNIIEHIKKMIELFNKYDGEKALILYEHYENGFDITELEKLDNITQLAFTCDLEKNGIKTEIPETNFDNMYYYSLALLYNKYYTKGNALPSEIFLTSRPELCKDIFKKEIISKFKKIANSEDIMTEKDFRYNLYDTENSLTLKDGSTVTIAEQDHEPDFEFFGDINSYEDYCTRFGKKYENELRFLIMAALKPILGCEEKYMFEDTSEKRGNSLGYNVFTNLLEHSDYILDDILYAGDSAEIYIAEDLYDFSCKINVDLNEYIPVFDSLSNDVTVCYDEDDVIKVFGSADEKSCESALNLFNAQNKIHSAYADNYLYEAIITRPSGDTEFIDCLLAEDIDEIFKDEIVINNYEQSMDR